jgi:hypothetical protein
MSFNLFQWRPRHAKSTRPAPARPGFRPCLEALEERLVPAQVTLYNVDDASNALTLRGAIARASSGDTIYVVTGALHKTITLTLGEIVITKSLTIKAISSSAPATISGGGTSRIFLIAPGATLTLQDLILTGGDGVANPSFGSSFDGEGGAILNEGMLLTNNCTLSGNSAANAGGALFNTSAAEGGPSDDDDYRRQYPVQQLRHWKLRSRRRRHLQRRIADDQCEYSLRQLRHRNRLRWGLRVRIRRCYRHR